MPTRLLLLLCLTGQVFANEPPDVDCLVVHLKYVHCSWNATGTPEANYTFYGWFHHDKVISECPSYLSEENTKTGCQQPYDDPGKRFYTFHTKLVHGNQTFQKALELKSKVKLNPPTNVSVQYGSDLNLWLSWNQIVRCVESQVRHRVNSRKWETSDANIQTQNFCINLPSRSSLYELQVRSRLGSSCGMSEFWSDWSKPVFWGSNNRTVTTKTKTSVSMWTPLLFAAGALILVLLVMLLLQHERIRIIFIPVVPKPSPKLHNMEDWYQFPKGLKESLNYNERPCPVREYCHVPLSDSEGSDCSSCSVTTDQTDCSVLIPGSGSDLSTSCSSSSSSSSAVLILPEEEAQVSV